MERVHGAMRNVRTFRSFTLFGGLLLCMTLHAQAALLGVGGNTNVWPGLPNLYSESLAISYTLNSTTTGLFSVTGTTSDYFDLLDNDNLVIDDYDDATPGAFTLSATVSTNGTLLGGTVSLSSTGGIYDAEYDPTPIFGPGTVLQGNLTAFGFLGATITNRSQFDFEFNVTGGELESVFGSKAGTVMYTEDYSFGGSFASNFSNGGAGDADTLMMVPEPEPQLLVILSVLGLCWVARSRASLRRG
jgi:hypothetical protein